VLLSGLGYLTSFNLVSGWLLQEVNLLIVFALEHINFVRLLLVPPGRRVVGLISSTDLICLYIHGSNDEG
jgi:hypothetical protein